MTDTIDSTEPGAREPSLSDPARSSGSRLDWGTWMPIAFFVLMIAFFGAREPENFLSFGNVTSILNNGAILAIVACGLTVVCLTGEFDLSVGSAASFGGAASAVLITRSEQSVLVAVLVVLAVGVVVGLVNGILVTYFRVHALIATLAVASLLDGFTLWTTGSQVIFVGFTDSFLNLGGWTWFGVQAGVYYLLAVALLLAGALRYTTTGRYIHAVGGNREASRMAGIRVDRYVILAFVLSGVLASLAGMLYTSRQGSLTPLFGTGFLLPAFAAVFLGSVTLRRSEFHIVGTMIGVYLIATGTAGLLTIGGATYTQQLFAGAVLILPTAATRLRKRRARTVSQRAVDTKTT